MKKPRIPPLALAGKVKILGDIISPIVDEEDWDFEFPFVKLVPLQTDTATAMEVQLMTIGIN